MEGLSYSRWGFIFLVPDSRLSKPECDYLARQANQMYFRNETRRNLATDFFEGVISTEGRYDSLGCFSGQRFDAELNTLKGKVNVRFIIDERTGRRDTVDECVN